MAELARHFPTPMLANVGDEVVDGDWQVPAGQPACPVRRAAGRFLAAPAVHYTGTDWRTIQPWILLTNYQRYVDQF